MVIKEANNLLAISSHVVHGHVGNTAMEFPLQLKNWNVDSLNTTFFSNHPGYGTFKGLKYTSSQISDIYQGLDKLGCSYNAIVVGYVASKENLEIIYENTLNYFNKYVDTYENGDNKNGTKISPRDPLWILDPVLGDNGKLYVNEDIIPIYKQILCSEYLTIVTPNQFEMELLTDTKIENIDDLTNSIKKFHSLYKVENLIITSVILKDLNANEMICVGSTKDSPNWFFLKFPIIDAIFSGSGDLFLALLTDSYYKKIHSPEYNRNEKQNYLIDALSETISLVYKVLKLTYDIETSNSNLNSIEKSKKINGKLYLPHLRIVESKDIFLESNSKLNQEPTFVPF
ncbi:hypothetical protein BVG19_g5199 [[Candida] boidinii]|nr:hypothetical protein BVG19_g5199 [[Candida] boidinii]OWB50758.1 transferase activity protein [[Candida] boidinii]OWB86441.1 transferase activity protein [[Candida] boidinii]